MKSTFWLENDKGVRELLAVADEAAALEIARQIYDNVAEDQNPENWLMKRDPDEDEDDVLVPGGPACEEFTWMPRSMWNEGGPLGALLD